VSAAGAIRIRPARVDDAAGIAEVQVATWRTAFRGIVADRALERLDVAQRTERWRGILADPNQTAFVAEADRDSAAVVVGFVVGGANRDREPPFSAPDGELYAIYVLDSHQRGGTGRRLVRALVDWLLDARHSAMLVWTLESSPFRAFYETLGGRRVGTREVTIDEEPYLGVAYAWDDLEALRRILPA
jgi:GNAT superfamily N-acetyltransferase